MKKILLFILLIVVTGFCFANGYTVGTGTVPQSNIPFYGLNDYGWSKMLYTKTEINAAGLVSSGYISGISFNVANSPSFYNTLNQRVYIRHTSATAEDISYPNPSSFTQVYNGAVTWNGTGWKTITFSNPYYWNNIQNLEILWENRDGSFLAGMPTFQSTNTGPAVLGAFLYANGGFPSVSGNTTYIRPNLRILTPPRAAILSYPSNAGWAFPGDVLSWTNGGGDPLGYKVYFGETDPPPYIQDQVTLTYTPTLAYNTTYYWRIIPFNNEGQAVTSIWSFHTPTTTQVAESFEGASFPPTGWDISASRNFGQSEVTAYHGTHSAQVSTSTSEIYLLSTPKCTITAASMLNFHAMASNVSQVLQIVYSPDRINWTQIGADITFATASTWTAEYQDFNSLEGNNYYIGFRTPVQTETGNIFIDSVFGPEPTPPPIFNYGPVTLDLGQGSQYTPTAWKYVTVTNNGGDVLNLAAADITITGADAAMFNLDTPTLPAALTAGQSVIIGVRFAASSEGAKTSTLRMLYNGTYYDVSLLGEGLPAGMMIIGTGTSSEPFVPVDGFYDYGWSKMLYTKAELNVAGLTTAGLISGISFYVANIPANYINLNQMVYIRHSMLPGEDNSYPYIASFIQVYNGSVTWNVSGWHNIMFSTPFYWNNINNLEIFWENRDGSDAPGYPVFLSSNTGPAYMAAYQYNNGVFPINGGYTFYFRPNLRILTPPRPAVLVYPADTGWVSPGESLSWADGGGQPTGYQVYFGDTTPPPFIQNQSGLTYTPALSVGTTYYWRIIPYNSLGQAGGTSIWSFTARAAGTGLPYVVDFEANGDNTLPADWSRSTLGPLGWQVGNNLSSEWWAIPAHTVYAASNDDAAGEDGDGSEDWLTSPLLNFSTAGITNLRLSFDSYYTGLYGQFASVGITTDQSNWIGLLDLVPANQWTNVAINLSSYINGAFQLRFYSDDAGQWGSGWAIDNIRIEEIPAWDVAAISIDMAEAIAPEPILPRATVFNNGSSSATFDVTMTIGTVYTDTQTVTGLVNGASTQVVFSSFLPVPEDSWTVTVTTHLVNDAIPANDEITGSLICVPLDVQVFGDVLPDANLDTIGPATFNLKTPGNITPLAYASTSQFISGADWINGGWYGVEFDDGSFTTDNWWKIDPVTGEETLLGEIGIRPSGVAYDPDNQILYGSSYNRLYTMNPITGHATIIGSFGLPLGMMGGIAYDNQNDVLYGVDGEYDALYSINVSTGAATLIGNLGLNISDYLSLAYDRIHGYLYLSGYTDHGALYVINTSDGSAWWIGDYPANVFIQGLAIPDGSIETPNVSIAADGTLSWDAVYGAENYNIYGSSEADGIYSLLINTSLTSWLDPLYPESRKFYKVCSNKSDNRSNTGNDFFQSLTVKPKLKGIPATSRLLNQSK